MNKKKKKKAPNNNDPLFFIGGLVLFVLSLVFFTVGWHMRSDAQNIKNYTAKPAKPFSISQPVQMGSVSATVNKVTYPAPTPPFKAPAGKQYAVVEILIKNRSEKPINIAPATDIYIKDAGGNISYLTPFAISNPFRAGELSPGEQIVGELSFLVNKNNSNKLYIDSIWSGGVISFKL